MNRRTRAGALQRALRSLMPEADVSIIHERPWHSLTFGGTQVCFSVVMNSGTMWDVSGLSAKLAEVEFYLPRQIVADIAVARAVVAKGAHCLLIDALLLDD